MMVMLMGCHYHQEDLWKASNRYRGAELASLLA
jgi:hypothetical protein